MATSKIEKPQQVHTNDGTFYLDYVTAYNILTMGYQKDGHEYAIHFEQGGLTYYADGTRKWHLNGS